MDERGLRLGEPDGWIPLNSIIITPYGNFGTINVIYESCGAKYWLDERLVIRILFSLYLFLLIYFLGFLPIKPQVW